MIKKLICSIFGHQKRIKTQGYDINHKRNYRGKSCKRCGYIYYYELL